MPLPENIQKEIYQYCENHLPDDKSWYNNQFEFIEDADLRQRLCMEFKSIRFAYKLYEGINANDENKIFEIRSQIIAYASLYEAVLHYVLYEYYNDTREFHEMQYHCVPTRIDIPRPQLETLNKLLNHNGETIITYHKQERKKEETQVRFDAKCKTAEKLGIIHNFKNHDGEIVNLVQELIEIYEYRNAIHLIAEQRKGITYEIDLSKRAYRRMRPFIDQVKGKLKEDGKSIYSIRF